MYKKGIPEYRKILEELRRDFARLGTKTDWVRLRVDPVLRHAQALDRLLNSRRFTTEFARLTKGVALFHSDLVYLSTNVRELRGLLRTEAKERTS